MADDASLRFNFLKGVDTASPHMDKVGDNAVRMAAKTSAAGALMQSRMALLGGAIVVASSEVIAFADALAPIGGLLAALPAVAFAGAASIGALALGFHGLAAALKTSAGGAGPSAAAIAAAERRVATAQREAAQAQLAVNQARQEAVRNLADLAQQLQLANLDQEESALSVKQAEDELAQARRSHDPARYERAQINLQRAQINLQQSAIHLADTQDQYNDAQRKGIEGSDKVQTALQKQADATQNLKDAQAALAQTKSGGGGVDKAAEAYAKLAPSAKAVVDALKSLGPAWRQVQQATQQALFAGLGDRIRTLGAVYLPMLKTGLSGVAQGWNIAFRDTADLARTAGFVRDTNTALRNTARFSQLAGKSLAPFVDGLRQFGTVGSQYLPRLGAFIRDIAIGFDRWATSARETGKINRWIEDGIRTAQTFWKILLNVGGAVKGIFRAGSGGPAFLTTLEGITGRFRSWVDSAGGQTKLHRFFSSLRDLADKLLTAIGGLATILVSAAPAVSTIGAYFSLAGWAIKFLADHADQLNRILVPALGLYLGWALVLKPVLGLIRGIGLAIDAAKLAWIAFRTTVLFLGPWAPLLLILAGVILLLKHLYDHSEAFRKKWDATWKWAVDHARWASDKIGGFLHALGAVFTKDFWVAGFKLALNAIIDDVNSLIRHFNSGIISSINDVSGIVGIPGIPAVPTIPHLAAGGIVHARTGGTLAVLGEGGQDEMVTPLPRGGGSGGGGRQQVDVRLVIDSGGSRYDDALVWHIRKAVKDRGGNVQFVLGGGTR